MTGWWETRQPVGGRKQAQPQLHFAVNTTYAAEFGMKRSLGLLKYRPKSPLTTLWEGWLSDILAPWHRGVRNRFCDKNVTLWGHSRKKTAEVHAVSNEVFIFALKSRVVKTRRLQNVNLCIRFVVAQINNYLCFVVCHIHMAFRQHQSANTIKIKLLNTSNT